MSLMLLTAFLTVTMFPGIVSAASEKRKLVASETTYFADGKKKNAISYKYDKYGNIIRNKSTFPYSDFSETVETRKNTYWKNTGLLKKVVRKFTSKSMPGVITETYTKKGILKKSVSDFDGYEKTITTYKNNGKRITSSVTKSVATGKVLTKQTYDKYGHATKTIDYDDRGTSVTTEKYTYKKGRLVKCVLSFGDGRKTTVTYDSHGNLVKTVFVFDDGSKSVSTWKNKYTKDGYLKESIVYNGTKQTKKNMTERTVFTYTKKKY